MTEINGLQLGAVKGDPILSSTCQVEHKTCDILAAERLRLMRFDNGLIIDSLKVECCSIVKKGK